jgi:hypothetical protein
MNGYSAQIVFDHHFTAHLAAINLLLQLFDGDLFKFEGGILQ